MLIKTYKNFLSEENKKFINNVLLSGTFPYYVSEFDSNHPHDPKDPSYKFFGHTVLQRKEDRNKERVFNSNYAKETLDILRNLFIKAKIKEVEFFRIAYNFTFNLGQDKSFIHTDHEYDHFQAIIYLTKTLDKNTPTVLVNSKNKPLEKSYPEPGKGIIFKKHPHYQVFPKKGARLVLVATFKQIK
tara:strand:- start:153 stop:710 length:558 start_codon:yes stop_codon:yes gene_type:complete